MEKRNDIKKKAKAYALAQTRMEQAMNLLEVSSWEDFRKVDSCLVSMTNLKSKFNKLSSKELEEIKKEANKSKNVFSEEFEEELKEQPSLGKSSKK